MTGYQMTDAIGTSAGVIEVGHDGPDVVIHVHGGRSAALDPQAWRQFRLAAAEAGYRAMAHAHPLPRAEKCPRCLSAEVEQPEHQAPCPHIWHAGRQETPND